MSPSETPKNLNEIVDPEVKQRVIACINEFYNAYPRYVRNKASNYYLTEFIIDGSWRVEQIRTPRFLQMFLEERDEQLEDIWSDNVNEYSPTNKLTTIQKQQMLEKLLTIYRNNIDFALNEQMVINIAKLIIEEKVPQVYINNNAIRDDCIRHAKDDLVPA